MATQTYNPITVFASAAYTADQTSTPVRSGLKSVSGGHTRGLAFVVDCTVVATTASVVFTLEVAAGGGSYSPIATSSAVTAAGTAVALVVHPDVATDVANFADQGPMKTYWRIVATHADGNSITYSVIAFPLT